MFKYLFLIAIVGALCGLVYIGKHGFMPGKAKPTIVAAPAPVPSGKPVPLEHVWHNGEHLRDELRASSEGYMQTAKYGVFRKGEMHELGRVIAVHREWCGIEVSPGVRIIVEAYVGKDTGPVLTEDERRRVADKPVALAIAK